MNKFSDKTAFISDGSSGIGLAIAREYIAEGGHVIITGTTESLGKALPELGPNAFGIAADTSNLKTVFKLKNIVEKIAPTIDMVFINADAANIELPENVTEEYFEQQFTSVVKGPYFIIQQLFPLLTEGSSIILNSSMNTGIEGAALFEAAQSTLINSLSEKLSSKNIRVHLFNPVLASKQLHGEQEFDADQLEQLANSVKWMITSRHLTDPMIIAELN
jgi:NAD(P)-dependent dehydrogenase (short-subunit alcohol dehydrogenase family)